MKHDWEELPRNFVRHRRCRYCHAEQTLESRQEWGRVVGYSWSPHVGKCTYLKRLINDANKKLRDNPPQVEPCPRCESTGPCKSDCPVAPWNLDEMKDPKQLTIKEVAKAINWKVEDWKGNCYAVATAIVDAGLVKGEAVYGHWVGAISKRSHFADRSNLGFTNHGWVLLDDGRIFDPTRWVFEATAPYLSVVDQRDHMECTDYEPEDPLVSICKHCGHEEDEHERGFYRKCRLCKWPYDEGGNELRTAMRLPPPKWDKKEERRKVLFKDAELAEFVRTLSDDTIMVYGEKRKLYGLLTKMQVFWLANTPYEQLGEHVHDVYEIYRKQLKRVGLIPIDNQRREERERKRKKTKRSA